MNGWKEIDSLKNPRIQGLHRLAQARARREQNLFLAEGEKMTREAVSCGLAKTVLFARARKSVMLFCWRTHWHRVRNAFRSRKT